MTKRNLPTIREVAKIAKVSTATVSHVFNNTRHVSDETKKLVLDAALKLNYYPSGIARSLSTNSTQAVGVVVVDVLNPFFANMISGIGEMLWGKGYNLLLCSTLEDPQKEKYYLQDLLERRVDGIIIAPTGVDQPLYEEIIRHDIPLVFIDRQPPKSYGPVVQIDNHQAGYISTEYLLKLGHRRIMLITRNPYLSTVRGRISGYKQAIMDFGEEVDENLIEIIDFTHDSARQAVINALNSDKPPTAIIATNQVITLGVLEALNNHHIICPDQVSIIGFDDLPWYSLLSPPLTAIRHPINSICEKSVEILISKMDDSNYEVDPSGQKQADQLFSDILLAPSLIERGSCSKILYQDN